MWGKAESDTCLDSRLGGDRRLLSQPTPHQSLRASSLKERASKAAIHRRCMSASLVEGGGFRKAKDGGSLWEGIIYPYEIVTEKYFCAF